MSRARRNILDLDEDVAPGAEGEAHVPAPPIVRQPRIVGAVRDMEDSISLLEREAAELEQIKALLASGGSVVELDTDLVDPSAFRERLDYDVSDLRKAIETRGQLVPILVRPHPEANGRYQIAYGNRRHAVCHELQRPVRAVVKDLTDAEMVVAQGQENAARKDLTFIELARFVANLKAVHPAVEIEREFGFNQSLVHKLTKVVREVPEALIQTIGRADGIGRPRWESLREAVKARTDEGASEEEIVAQAKAALAAARARRTEELKSHMRFEAVFAVFVSGKQKEVVDLSTESGKSLGKLVRTETGSNLKLNDPAFVDHLLGMLPDLHRQYVERSKRSEAGVQDAAE